MAVTSVDADWQNITGKDGSDGKVTFSVPYKVATNSANDGPLVVLSATTSGLPAINESYTFGNESFSGLRVKTRSAARVDRKQWIVTCEYSTQDTTGVGGDDPANPLLRTPKVRFGGNPGTRAIDKDRDGTEIKNSAGQKFDEILEIPWSTPFFTIEKNFSSYNTLLVESYQNAVNSDTFHGFIAGIVRVESLEISNEEENDISYVRVLGEFHVNRDKWVPLQVVNSGYMEKSGSDLIRIKDKDKQNVSEPVLLDADGAALTAGSAATFQDFNIYFEKPFSTLGL